MVSAADVPPPAGDLAISAATIAESHFGVLVARDATTRALPLCRLSTLERHVDPLPVDDAVAGSYGQLAAAVVGPGRQPRTRVMDLLIAATAHARDARLYTRSADDLTALAESPDIVPVCSGSPRRAPAAAVLTRVR